MSGEARAADLLTRMRQGAIKQPPNKEFEAATVAREIPPAARSFDVAGAQHPLIKTARPIRYTLDLAREKHRFPNQFVLDAEADASEVMRALLHLLEDEPSLASTVRARLPRAGPRWQTASAPHALPAPTERRQLPRWCS